MNTANLQLEGIYAILAALVGVMREKGLLDTAEIDQLLTNVETALAFDQHRPTELRGANVDAICFPARFLRVALQASCDGQRLSFSQLAGQVGLTKPDH